jgi:hypothetical protein
MSIGFSNAGVTVNNIPISILPNSLKITHGAGEINTRSMQAGGGAVEMVHTEKTDTKKGKIVFEVAVTDANQSLAAIWKALIGANVIVAIQLGMKPVVLQEASMINDPEWEASADGKASIEFEGAPF